MIDNITLTFNEWLKASKVTDKKTAFEYFVFCLIRWWAEINPNDKFDKNDLSVLKVTLLLFLAIASSADKKNDGLLNIFNNWEAVPYGAREVDIFKLMREEDAFSWFTIDNKRITLTGMPPFFK